MRRGDNLLCFGLPGRGKSHLVAALGREWVQRHQLKVLFTPTFKLVTQLLAAKRDLKLPSALMKLERFDVVILDDIGYVQQSREEMEVLFTFLAERYEKKSVVITSNLGFSQWDQIFKDPMTTMAAIDRLVGAGRTACLYATGWSYGRLLRGKRSRIRCRSRLKAEKCSQRVLPADTSRSQPESDDTKGRVINRRPWLSSPMDH